MTLSLMTTFHAQQISGTGKFHCQGKNPVIFRSYEIGNQENTVTKTNDELNSGICPKHFYKTLSAVFAGSLESAN